MPFKDPQAQRAYQREWRQRRRDEFMADKTCDRCGSTMGLQLHHRDPMQKIGHNVWSWSAERRAVELAKCEILCDSCHRDHHGETRRRQAELRNPHGTNAAYHRGCACPECCAGHAAAYLEWRQKTA